MKKDELEGHIARINVIKIIYVYRILIGKPEVERPLGRSRHR
jgi:hypothetical protein